MVQQALKSINTGSRMLVAVLLLLQQKVWDNLDVYEKHPMYALGSVNSIELESHTIYKFDYVTHPQLRSLQ